MHRVATPRWDCLLGSLLHDIFSHLDARDLAVAGASNRHWYRISRTDELWQPLFEEKHDLWDCSKLLITEAYFDEYTYFENQIPTKKTQVVDDFEIELKHVTFSSNGKYFAVCGANALIWLWRTEPEIEFLTEKDLAKSLQWVEADTIEFSPDEAKLLVNGKKTGGRREFSCFSISETGSVRYLCRIMCTPLEYLGCWLDSRYVLSGEFYQFGSPTSLGDSISQLWLCSVPDDIFLNRTGRVCQVLIARHVSPRFRRILQLADEARWEQTTLSHKLLELKTRAEIECEDADKELDSLKKLLDTESECGECYAHHTLKAQPADFECHCECHQPADRLMIYVNGDLCHRLNFKVISQKMINKALNFENYTTEKKAAPENETDSLESIMEQIDQPDYFVELDGSIQGLSLSTDHRMLEFAVRVVVEDTVGEVVGSQLEHRRVDLGKMIVEKKPVAGRPISRVTCSSQRIVISTHRRELLLWARDYGAEPVANLVHEHPITCSAVHPDNSILLACVGMDLHIWESPLRVKSSSPPCG
ncbi:unnamed protein product, partial [Mesorhabditis spiculigera]